MFELHRVSVLKEGAFGVLLEHGYPVVLTLERTYDELDELTVSTKIPPGLFECTRTFFHRGGYETFEIHVTGHSRLLFHRGNVEEDSEGCVLVGESFGLLNGQPGILGSERGFRRFMVRTAGLPDFSLRVSERRAP